jgi:hypothetical protein
LLITVVRGPPVQYRTANASRRFYARNRRERSEQIAFRSHDADLAVGNLDPLGQGTQMVAAIAAFDSHPLAAVAANLRSIVAVTGCWAALSSMA